MKTVLITGGSSGIGFALSKAFSQEQNIRLIWVSHDQKELEYSAQKLRQNHPSVTLEMFTQDLSLDDGAQKVFDWTEQNKWTVDVLVNNAGIGSYGYLQDTDYDQELRLLQLNVMNLYKLTRLYLTPMIARDAGMIINLSSISSFLSVPRMNTYASSKAFVKHFTEGLQEELRMQDSKVHIFPVFPAALADTPFREKEDMQGVKTFDGLVYTTAEEVARDIYNGYKRKKKSVLTGRKMRLLNPFQKLMPLALRKYLVRMESDKA